MRATQDGCTGMWGLCLTSPGTRKDTLGAYFKDLPPNMLGSFFIGLFAASSTLGIPVKKVRSAVQPLWRALLPPERQTGSNEAVRRYGYRSAHACAHDARCEKRIPADGFIYTMAVAAACVRDI